MTTIRVGFCSLVGFAVLAYGATEPRGQFLLEAGAAALLILWIVQALRAGRIAVRWSGVWLPMIALAGFGVLQVVLGISAYSYATRVELLRAGAYLMLGFMAAQCFDSPGRRLGFAWFLAALAFAVSLFGIVQRFTWTGKIYWVRELPPGAVPFGPFQNSDHFAGFVELTVPMGLALLAGGAVARRRAPLLGVFCVLPMGALFMTGSRGGVAGFVFGLLLLACLLRSIRLARTRILLGLAACVAVVALWLGVHSRFTSLESFSPETLSQDRRVAMFRDAWRIFVHHPWVGTGLGTFRAVYPAYESYYDGRIVEHAHNDYLEWLAETGLAGGLCGAVFLVLLYRTGWANLRRARARSDRCFVAGALAACSGLLVHSLVDFNLHIPANAAVFVALATLAASRPAEAHQSRQQEVSSAGRLRVNPPTEAETQAAGAAGG